MRRDAQHQSADDLRQDYDEVYLEDDGMNSCTKARDKLEEKASLGGGWEDTEWSKVDSVCVIE